MPDLYLISVLIFFTILAILIYRDRKHIEWKYYVLFLRKTKKFANIINNIAKKSPLIWKIIATIAIAVSFYYMANGLYILFNLSYYISIGEIKQPVLQFILPTPKAVGTAGPGYILIPFWIWIIIIFSILVPHELCHGIIARAEKIKLKSVGLLLLAIFPGAFVEPDEKQLKKAKLLTKLRIFAVGSAANFGVAAFVFLLTSYTIWPAMVLPGVQLLNVTEASPAEDAGLETGMILTEMNGKIIKTSYGEFLSGRGYFQDEIGIVKPGEIISIKSNGNLYNIKLASVNNTAYMGINYKPLFRVKAESFFIFINLLTMVWLFSFAVGLFNILPIFPLDGGLMIQAITDKFAKKYSKQIVMTITYTMLLLILFDFIGPSLLKV